MRFVAIALATVAIASGQGTPVITGVVGGFGLQPFVSPSGLANVLGRNLATTAGFSFGTTRVLVNGVQARLEFIQLDAATELHTVTFQIPPQTPLGNTTFVVSRAGISSAPFTFAVSQYAPQLAGVGTAGLARLHHADGSTLDANSPAIPGEKVKCVVSGLGDPPATPTLLVGGFPAVIESILSNDPVFDFPGVQALTFVVPPQLGSGSVPISIAIGNLSSVTRTLPIRTTGLTVSQSGVTFRAGAGSTAPLQRTLSVISTSAPITWNATAATVTGGTWLQVTPATGISDPARAAPTIQVSATVGTLTAGDYYGTITIRATNLSVVISVVLSVRPAAQSPGPIVEPAGLVFVGSAGAAKTIRVSNPTTSALTFSIFTQSSEPAWFTVSLPPVSVAPGASVTLTVQSNAPFSGNGRLTLAFSDGTQRSIDLEGVSAAANCTPAKLFAVPTLLNSKFAVSVGWAQNLDAMVVDNCGTAVTNAMVTASFSNGDPPLGLVSVGDGHWSATWTPRNASADMQVTISARLVTPDLSATSVLQGSAVANPNVPIVFGGGVVGTASYVASPAPGSLLSIFGAELADDLFVSSQVPRPNQILSTQVLLGGVNLPLLFVSKGQINALVPYGLRPKTTSQLIVRRGDAISSPETLAVLDSQPGVFTLDLSGKGQGHVYRNTPSGLQILAAPAAAVTTGDVVTVYCAGLGEVNPPSVAGTPARLDVVQNTTNPVTATIGGVEATVLFAGLSPGFTGLYQVNLVVPDGVTPGNSVALVLTSAGQVSQVVTIAVK